MKWFCYIFPPVFGITLAFAVGLGKRWYDGGSGAPWCDFGDDYTWGMAYSVFAIFCGICLFCVSSIFIKLMMVSNNLLLQTHDYA